MIYSIIHAMKRIFLPITCTLLLASCTSSSSDKHKQPESTATENQKIIQVYSSDKEILELINIPDNLWVMTRPINLEAQIDDAMNSVLRQLGYKGKKIDDPVGIAVSRPGGIIHTEGRRKKQSYITEIAGNDKPLTVNAKIVSCYFLAEEGNVPHPYSGPVIKVRSDTSTRSFLFPSFLIRSRDIYSPSVVLGVRISAKPQGGKYAQQTVFISAVVGFTPAELAKMEFRMHDSNNKASFIN